MKRVHFSCQIFKNLEFSVQIFAKSSDVKFHENPSRGSRVVLGGPTDLTKLIVAFRNFAKESENHFTPNNYSIKHKM